jgi:hypothetical protein
MANASLLEQQAADLNLTSIGAKGGILITDTTAITGEFRAIKAYTDCTFTTLTTPNLTKNGVVTAVTGGDWGTLSQGDDITTKITACTLASGKALLYK